MPELRTILGRVPSAAWICALVACLSAASWSFITPPFQVPDEQDHFAYTRLLAETGSLPTETEERYSQEETLALTGVNYVGIRQRPSVKVTTSKATQARLNQELANFNHAKETPESKSAGVATSEPPLYYALQTIPFAAGWSGTVLDRLQLMRLLSVLMAGITALFAFFFIRETLPRVRWAWTVGALGVALSPLFGFMSGGVNPDAMLFAVSSALFYCLARAFRRGLTLRLAIATGLLIATGFLTKLSFVGLAPGAFLALGMLAVRGIRNSDRAVVRPAAIAAALGCLPLLLLVLRNVLAGRSPLNLVGFTLAHTKGSVFTIANYVWQFYLPRLPGTANDFPGLFVPHQIWFDGYVGRLGWLDTYFPEWVYTIALLVAVPIVALCIRSLVACREALRGRLLELGAYVVMAVGLLIVVGVSSYRAFPTQTASFGQARYLLPLLPLFGVTLALAARGAGRRWGPAVGVLIVLLFLAHDLFSQLQVISRYYA